MTDAAAPPIVVGRVRKPHGLKGELAVFPLTDDPAAVFVVGREIQLRDLAGELVGDVVIDQVRLYHRECLLKFRGHDRREAVDGYRQLFLAVAREALPPLADGEVYQQELVGWAVRDAADEPLGIVSEVYDLPQGTTIEVQGPKREFLVPFRAEYVKQVDRATRRLVVVLPDGWVGVAVLTVNVVTLFPETLAPYLAASIPGRAVAAGKVAFRLVQLRDFATDRHQTVDDYAFGGGAGMVLRAEPFLAAVESLGATGPVVAMSARGRRFAHDDAVRWSLGRQLTLLCGHYKDIDQRVVDLLGADEVSIGDFVLSGGEPAALCVIDAVVRLLPGAIGDHESASSDSHYDGLLSPPSYTRPAEVRGLPVPEVLLSGNHAAIAAWRQQQAEAMTQQRRPDLWAAYMATERQDSGAKS